MKSLKFACIFRVDFSLILWWHKGFSRMTTFSWFHKNYISLLFFLGNKILWISQFFSEILRIDSREILFSRKFDPAKIKTLKVCFIHVNPFLFFNDHSVQRPRLPPFLPFSCWLFASANLNNFFDDFFWLRLLKFVYPFSLMIIHYDRLIIQYCYLACSCISRLTLDGFSILLISGFIDLGSFI